MAYTKQTWADLPSKTTPINAERLTHIEDGIFNAAQTADTAASTAGTAAANVGIVSGRVETLTGRVNGLDTAVSNKVDNSKIGAANGVAGLDSTGRVPSSQLPSYVDDVLEYASVSAFPVTGEAGKIYVALDTNKTYRWSGSAYVEISESLALGETQGTAYEGSKGKANADAIATIQNTLGTLGTASTKNSTSVVTESSDLVESGAVKDIVGWGNKNVLPNDLVSGTYGNACVMTRNADGSITVSGQNTSGSDINIEICTLPYDAVKGFYISGVSNGSATTYMIFARIQNASLGYITEVDNIEGSTLIPTGIDQADSVRFNVRVKAGHTFPNPVTIYPMVSKDGGAYEPYHASVADSLEDKADNSVIGTVEDGANPTKAYAVGEHMVRGGKFCTVTVAVTTSSTWTLGSNYVEGTIADNLVKQDTFSATTSVSGNFRVSEDNTRVILRVIDAGHIIIPYKTSDDKNNAHVMNADMSTVTNSLVSGTYYYI